MFLVIVLAIVALIGVAKIISQTIEDQNGKMFTGTWVDNKGNELKLFFNGSSTSSKTVIYTPLNNETLRGKVSFIKNNMAFIWDNSAEWWFCDYYFSNNGKTLTLTYPIFTSSETEYQTMTFYKQ